MDLGSDIIGTNPQLPKIVDHSWLNVDLSKYDNFPSDNNPVRIVPKLHDLWNHQSSSGLNLIPNSQVLPLGARASSEDAQTVTEIIREAKKAIMAGLHGKDLSKHLRARFASKHLSLAADELKKLSSEIGLLGNVYIDASAFHSYEDAEQFLRQHRNRLARDIVMNSDKMSHNVVSMLASTFHKNAVADVVYDEKLFKKYKDHLVSSGLIPSDFSIESKEDLRNAFLYKAPQVVQEEKVKEAKVLDPKDVAAGLADMSLERSLKNVDAADAMILSQVTPVLSFVQENIAKGKPIAAVKDMLRARFVMEDIKRASDGLSVILSKEGLTEANINAMIIDGKITSVMGSELKRIGKKFPVKQATIQNPVKSERTVGVQATFFTGGTKAVSAHATYRDASVKALQKGISLARIKAKLVEKISKEEANQVLSEAVALLNATPAGAVANKAQKPVKEVLVADKAPRQTLPDPNTIIPQTKEILSVFEGAQMNVEIDDPVNYKGYEVEGLFNRAGIDEVLL